MARNYKHIYDDQEVKAQWYAEEDDGSYSLSPQIWNLPVKKCYLLDGSNIQGEMMLAPSKAESMYITTDTRIPRLKGTG